MEILSKVNCKLPVGAVESLQQEFFFSLLAQLLFCPTSCLQYLPQTPKKCQSQGQTCLILV